MKIGIYNNQIITEMFFNRIGIDNIINIQDVDNKYPQIQEGLYDYPLICMEDLDSNGIFNENLYNERQIKSKRYFETQPLIEELKNKLSSTDYQAIKYAEGQLNETEYAPIKIQRQEWRDEINKLEEELNNVR